MDNRRYRVVRSFHGCNMDDGTLALVHENFLRCSRERRCGHVDLYGNTGFNFHLYTADDNAPLDILYSVLWWCYRTRGICSGQNNTPKRSHDDDDERRCFLIHSRPHLIHFRIVDPHYDRSLLRLDHDDAQAVSCILLF